MRVEYDLIFGSKGPIASEVVIHQNANEIAPELKANEPEIDIVDEAIANGIDEVDDSLVNEQVDAQQEHVIRHVSNEMADGEEQYLRDYPFLNSVAEDFPWDEYEEFPSFEEFYGANSPFKDILNATEEDAKVEEVKQ
eukprot:TRINITY_DN5188_c0_g1_i1.p1 TRINITY_DN5188_c0_g1~~TRINITY_DN5188_c0_g1_i1.p1  ORF type:complete len:138 (-),score=53.90 TRINITY_DN5188_c0_g1_i1:32-445(-)